MDETKSLQDQFAPNLICFGCGPANDKGLRIKSFVEGDKVIATFTPQPHQQAFEGMVNGGIIGVVLDCHLNWTAAWHLMEKNNLDSPPCCVTAKYEVAFEKPTPSHTPLQLEAWVVESSDRKSVVEGTIGPAGEPTARCRGTFVAVKPGHPAYHRW
jgi:acyl-coenzyme A thioesterase PaaI-like protein